MARSCTYRNAAKTLIDGSNTLVPTFAVFCAPTPAPAQTFISIKALATTQAPASILVFAFAPGPPEKYTNKNLQKVTKLALELFVKGQEHGQLEANFSPCKQLLKA